MNLSDEQVDELLRNDDFRRDLSEALQASGHHGELEQMDVDELRNVSREFVSFLQNQQEQQPDGTATISDDEAEALLNDVNLRRELGDVLARSDVKMSFDDLPREQQLELVKSFVGYQREREQLDGAIQKILADDQARAQLEQLQSEIEAETGRKPSLEELAEGILRNAADDTGGEG